MHKLVFFFAVLAMAVPSVTYATDESADDFVSALPNAGHATRSSVSTEVSQEYYDMYSRQIAYRQNAKNFREMLEERQKSFVAPQVAAVEGYRHNVEKVYSAEAAAIAGGGDMTSDAATDDQAVVVHDEPARDGGILREIDVPASVDADAGRVVVTSDDAPEFDPSRL